MPLANGPLVDTVELATWLYTVVPEPSLWHVSPGTYTYEVTEPVESRLVVERSVALSEIESPVPPADSLTSVVIVGEAVITTGSEPRSEERRVGKECR